MGISSGSFRSESCLKRTGYDPVWTRKGKLGYRCLGVDDLSHDLLPSCTADRVSQNRARAASKANTCAVFAADFEDIEAIANGTCVVPNYGENTFG